MPLFRAVPEDATDRVRWQTDGLEVVWCWPTAFAAPRQAPIWLEFELYRQARQIDPIL